MLIAVTLVFRIINKGTFSCKKYSVFKRKKLEAKQERIITSQSFGSQEIKYRYRVLRETNEKVSESTKLAPRTDIHRILSFEVAMEHQLMLSYQEKYSYLLEKKTNLERYMVQVLQDYIRAYQTAGVFAMFHRII